ncbi:hypothetical protein [Synechococcus sp. BDU 130192]|uniref:hypothetical protein n=1 Tax=Synechococcus sp. BDU 130192 TaxID=2042059 RepID=UPI000C08AA87|nr:hypothetical protein [Synechococcus sp. BDU 130192]
MSDDNGVLLIAHGKKKFYIQAACLAWSIKKSNPKLPVALACDHNSCESELFHPYDQIITWNFSDWPGVSAKVNIDRLTPFSGQTMFIDSDSLVYSDLLSIFQKYSHLNFVALGKNINHVGHWFLDCNRVKEYFNVKVIPFFTGDFYLFKKNETGIFERARKMRSIYDQLGCIRARGGSMSDERLIAMALMSNGFSVQTRDLSDIVSLQENGMTYYFSDILSTKRKVVVNNHSYEPKIIHFADYATQIKYMTEIERVRMSLTNFSSNHTFLKLLGGIKGVSSSLFQRSMSRFSKLIS